MFRDHVGISPKRLVQYMNMRHARDLLLRGMPTLDAAYGSGLSGNGRLHDTAISIEAATPGEIKTRGAGMTITYGHAPTPLGDMLIARTARGICYLGFQLQNGREGPQAKMRAHFPRARFVHDDPGHRAGCRAIAALWRGGRTGRLGLDLYGSNLQIQVWRALLQIPAGSTVNYGQLAAHLGRPKAARAVGNAVGANPVSLLIPCHRVIQATGIVNNYNWGSPRKKLILGVEGAQAAAL